MRRVYCISGLGADERIFSQLNVPDADFIYLRWFVPAKGESIAGYAARMKEQVEELEDPVFIGVSFGGMMAIELAKYYPAATVVLISSVKSRKELPAWMKWVGVLGLYRLVPSRSKGRFRTIGRGFLGEETQEEIRLSDEYRQNIDPAYLYWSIRQIVSWKNAWRPPALYHIHGSKDKTFPLKKIAATHVIPRGGHFMIMNRGREVSAILQALLAKLSGSIH
jgi:pimeloyl-ACP methyl ester carboxylesterase